MVRHFLAALAYRFQKAIKDAPETFPTFDAGQGIRQPIAIVHHMPVVLGYGKVALQTHDFNYYHQVPYLSWEKQILLFHETLQALDSLLSTNVFEEEILERLLQGPLSDAMTHVGQLAMLRRMVGSPIQGENFFKADIKTGDVSQHQPDPVSPDDK
jgi:hypothetical protein